MTGFKNGELCGGELTINLRQCLSFSGAPAGGTDTMGDRDGRLEGKKHVGSQRAVQRLQFTQELRRLQLIKQIEERKKKTYQALCYFLWDRIF